MSLFGSIIESNLDFFSIASNSVKILDVGCGNGDEVHRLRVAGYQAYGADVEFKDGPNRALLERAGIIKKIDIGEKTRATLKSGEHYCWPEFDQAFDVIVSRAVIEHVQNLDDFIQSSRRVMVASGGICLHYFPSKYALVEPHTGVPFGGLLVNEKWFGLMCSWGLCFKKMRGRGKDAFNYMLNYTSYRSQKDIDRNFSNAGFVRIRCCDVLRCHNKRYIRLLSYLPFINFFFSVFRSRVVAYQL